MAGTDFKAKINELLATKAAKVETAKKLIDDGRFEDAAKINDELDAINDQLDTLRKLSDASEGIAAPMGELETAAPKADKPLHIYNSLGEQLRDIVDAARGNRVSDKLARVQDAMTHTTGNGGDGGFFIQEDFAGAIFETAAQTGDILSRVRRFPVSSNANRMTWLQANENDVSHSVYGGVQMYWAGEAETVAESKIRVKKLSLDLEKMMGFAFASNEMLEDVPFMSEYFGTCFSVAADRLLEESIVAGDGVGKPLGYMKSKALVTVEKDAQQAAGTITAQNILKMWERMPNRNRRNAVWVMHPDCESLLPELKIGDALVWMPEGGISGNAYQTLRGRPVVFTDQCSPLGTAGDVTLVDLSQYYLLYKGNVRQQWSVEVRFMTDESVFRVVFRCNGAPAVDTPIKIKNSTLLRSPFVALGDRK